MDDIYDLQESEVFVKKGYQLLVPPDIDERYKDDKFGIKRFFDGYKMEIVKLIEKDQMNKSSLDQIFKDLKYDLKTLLKFNKRCKSDINSEMSELHQWLESKKII